MFKHPGINPTCYVLERQYQKKCEIRSKLFSERLANARSLYKKDLFAHYGCVNAIEFSNDGELLISGGDDRRVLLWSMLNALHGEGSPVSMRTNHLSNIFCLGFDSKNCRIFSGGNDDQLLIHDIQTKLLVDRLLHKKPIYGLNVNPQNDDIVATAGDDGRVLIYDLRETSEAGSILCLAKQKSSFHSVMYNPGNTIMLTTSNADEGISLWDCRKPRERLIHFDSHAGPASGINACFNSSGTRILALRRRLPPVMYNCHQEENICQFYHPHYYNSCTMKTCCFAGENDEYVLSGSDDFNLYMWSIPEEKTDWGSTHLVLEGHRSIVNQVRYNKQNNVIASSGVEKMVKFWSTLPFGDWEGSLLNEESEPGRSVYTHEEYMRLVGVTGERISHDYSEHSILEDSRMMAFFDSLIQREIEGWDSPNNNSDSGSDSSSQSYKAMKKMMFVNSRKLNEEHKKAKQNKISQLISKKQNALMKMAHYKSLKHRRNGTHKDSSEKQLQSCKCKNTKQKKNNSSKKSPRKECADEKGTSKKESLPTKRKLRKHRTRGFCNDLSTPIDTPSTSTGITSSHNNVFRVIEQDSEEDIPSNGCIERSVVQEENLVNILPTPINGTQDTFVHTLTTYSNDISGSTIDDTISSPSTSRQNRHRYDSAVCIDGGLDRASSSNDVTSSFPRSSFNGSYPPLDMNSDNTDDSDSDCDIDYVTPVKRRCTISDLDSGFATGPSSSMNSYEKNSNSHQECSDDDTSCSSDDELKYERFRKRTRKNRVNNIRKKIDDSDSN